MSFDANRFSDAARLLDLLVILRRETNKREVDVLYAQLLELDYVILTNPIGSPKFILYSDAYHRIAPRYDLLVRSISEHAT